ncbi:MAG: hypothetical protein RQ745_03150 [Longimicrobiales bacterium]|nr:hypothetical protein [Longimicrobiales bacterium]
MRSIRIPASVALVLALALTTPPPLAAQDLPPAEEIIDRYVEAIGGREAALTPVSTRTTGSFSMPAMGVTGDLVLLTGEENEMVTRVTVPGMGELLSGYTGEVGWSVDPLTGARLLDGLELAAMEDQADRRYLVRDPALFERFETVGEEAYGGEACWEIEYVWRSGRTSRECYSKESGLVIAAVTTQASPMGSIEVVTEISEYRRFGEILVPTSMRQNAMGQEQVMTIETVEFGTVEAAEFEPPAAIRTLINAGG